MKKILLLVLAFSFVNCGFQIVDTGFRGVKTRFGKVVGDVTLDEGLHFYNPFTSAIVELDVREQKWSDETLAYTKDIQNVKVRFTLNYYPDKDKMHVFYQNVGRYWPEKVIPQVVYGKIKEIVGKYEAVDLIGQRQKATQDITDLIAKTLKTKNITIKGFEVTNFDFNDAFENAVEKKVVAIENAKAAKNKTVQVKEEAKQRIIAAEAEAKSMQIRAEALAQNKSLVQYEAVQKWNGVLPQYVMGGTIPFINIGSTKDAK